MASAVTEASAHSTTALKQQLMQIADGFLLSSCLHVATKLKIADLVADGPRPVEALAAATGSNADGLYRVLRALVSVGIFSESQPRTIALSPAAELLRSDGPGSIRELALWVSNPFLIHVTSDLLYSVVPPGPAQGVRPVSTRRT